MDEITLALARLVCKTTEDKLELYELGLIRGIEIGAEECLKVARQCEGTQAGVIASECEGRIRALKPKENKS